MSDDIIRGIPTWSCDWTYICRLVVGVAVVEHLSEVLDALLGTVVGLRLQLLLDDAHVHGTLDHVEIILE